MNLTSCEQNAYSQIKPPNAQDSAFYAAKWDLVEANKLKRLPQSALAHVMDIHNRAKEKGHKSQYLKATATRILLESGQQENHTAYLFGELKRETDAAEFPERNILHSLLAETYWQYLEQNYWKIQNRGKVAGEIGDDLETWDVRSFNRRIMEHYRQSLQPREALMKLPARVLPDIIEAAEDSERYRPSLFDVLAYRFLEYNSGGQYIDEAAAVAYNPATLDVLLPAKDFIGRRREWSDSASRRIMALNIYQDLLGLHLESKDPSARIVADIGRLKYAREICRHHKKDSVYQVRLAELLAQFHDHESSALLLFELATHEFEKENYVGAAELCRKAAQRFPQSPGAKMCLPLLGDIERKDLRTQCEENIPPQSDWRFLLEYRNIATIYVRVVPLDWSNDIMENEQAAMLNTITAKPLHEFSVAVPASEDYKKHSVEIPMPPVNLGVYTLLVSDNPEFDKNAGAIVGSIVWCSRLALVREGREGAHGIFRVLNAKTGQALGGADVIVHSRYYDYRKRSNIEHKILEQKTGKDGLFRVAFDSRYQGNYDVALTLDKDHIYYRGNYHYADRDYTTAPHNNILFFTDRSIYRPGQTIYFKGIVYAADSQKPDYATIEGYSTTVELRDVNGKVIETQKLRSNKFGSIHGSFTAPYGLTGKVSIRAERSGVSFRVEEYKRPKFEVEIEELRSMVKLGESVQLQGQATAYAGAALDGAIVRYTVERTAYFPFWSYRRWYYPAPPAQQIAFGELRTRDDGTFAIEFTAEPDFSIDAETNPVFNFQVHVDVIDINGETHSAETTVKVGYTALHIQIAAPDIITRREGGQIRFQSSNLNGGRLSAEMSVSIEKLREPEQILRPRLWGRADTAIIGKEQYRKLFPHDVYRDEDSPEYFPVDTEVLRQSIRTDSNGEWSLPMHNYAAGFYRISAKAIDKFGQEVQVRSHIKLLDESSSRPFGNQAFEVFNLNPVCQPGDSAVFLLSTAYENAEVLYKVMYRDQVLAEKRLTLDASARRISFPVAEGHRGGIGVAFMMVHDYRYYSKQLDISVPWTNKDLSIELGTFRDKLAPGQAEEWRLTVKGPMKDVVAAEVLAAMYDASLDALNPHEWLPFAWPVYGHHHRNFNLRQFGLASRYGHQKEPDSWHQRYPYYQLEFDRLWLNGSYFLNSQYLVEHVRISYRRSVDDQALTQPLNPGGMAAEYGNSIEDVVSTMSAGAESFKEANDSSPPQSASPKPEKQNRPIQTRKDFRETAFFVPDVQTNADGDIILKFTMPEALTRWRFMALAHTPAMQTGRIEQSIVTQKDLMILPNAPRFLREGDEIVFPVKISNMSAMPLEGTAELEILDAQSGENLNAELGVQTARQDFKVSASGGTALSWNLKVASGLQAVMYRLTARAGNFSDGEENMLPVLSNRMMVTETLPLPVRGGKAQTFRFEKLAKAAQSPTLRHHKLTLEMTSNPAWYAVQALPYIMEYPYECLEQSFSRYFANTVAAGLVKDKPKIRRVFERWKSEGGLVSRLQKNEDLKMLVLEETPWLVQGRNEQERMQRLALLFDLTRMAAEQEKVLAMLENAQYPSGGWPWFSGGPESRYITQHIVSGFGYLKNMGLLEGNARVQRMLSAALRYMDLELQAEYLRMKQHKDFNPAADNLANICAHYLYTRSFFASEDIAPEAREAYDYWLQQAEKYWTKRGIMEQAMLALALDRLMAKSTMPRAVVASLKERALQSEEMGMHWKMDNGWFWYQAPIETQAIVIELFDEVARDKQAVEEMKVWLLKQKQVQDWKTTRATALACYALLGRGADLLADDALVDITIGGKKLDPRTLDGANIEAGTGYFRTSWGAGEITPAMAEVTVRKPGTGIAWGGVYWQYFEQLDKITPHKSPLAIDKKLFVQRLSSEGALLESVDENSVLKPGDLLTVRVEIRVDRAMEYVHLKDMRAAGLEPVEALSGYRYKGGLGYYQSIRDASMNFFISWLPKGTHVFEYDLRVSHSGIFTNGITTMQSMYAPEFSSHSEGRILKVQ